ncbi:MAG: DNA alkylation repair protein, partial [Psychrosphaera sp.]|nr:DNA alkylation repair protein [Psychrosphaera sp.]
MSTLFKDLYCPAFYTEFSKALAKAITPFDDKQFQQLIFCPQFDGYELKQRMTHTAKVMHHFLPKDFTLG